ncbi:MAG: 16S rRNA (guanine(527)-N(7))-methyltransferase RsmG [Porphyromonadaceae bacterium]|nr:16S rRNA (guanine(527)-N(7))-methyltransferase RsmG [Porphyromonadaceae bacterium]
MQVIEKYFPHLTPQQYDQLAALQGLYNDWNAKINVISRKDIDNLYLHHVLHSLGIAKVIQFTPTTALLDVGTGGGFPGIPLAILFPECRFHLIDRIGKKVRVAQEVAQAIGLRNVTFAHRSLEEEKGRYDFIVSRAVMPLGDLLRLARKNISDRQHNAMPNGVFCLKGGEIQAEIASVRRMADIFNLEDYFEEPFFQAKKVIYVPL